MEIFLWHGASDDHGPKREMSQLRGDGGCLDPVPRASTLRIRILKRTKDRWPPIIREIVDFER